MVTLAVICDTALSTLKLCNICYKCCATKKEDSKDDKSTSSQPVNQINTTINIVKTPPSSSANLPELADQAQGNSGVKTIEKSIVEWVASSVKEAKTLTYRAYVGGYDIDGSNLWIIKAGLLGEEIPGKFNCQCELAFVSTTRDGSYAERNVNVFEVCCVAEENRPRIKWIKCRGGYVPKNAIVGGRQRTGDPLYIGRTLHIDETDKNITSQCPGWIHTGDGLLYITFDYKVYTYKSYEVMCVE